MVPEQGSPRFPRSLDRLGDVEGPHVRPLAYGMTAALVGTIAANFFYLTMQFYYFYAFVAFALALPVVQAAARVLRDVATFDSAGVSGAKG